MKQADFIKMMLLKVTEITVIDKKRDFKIEKDTDNI